MERAIIEALGRRAMTSRELARLGDQREIASALALLVAERIVETAEATRGRHRSASAVRLTPDGAAAVKLRGAKQREIVRLLGEAAPEPLALEELEERIPGARAAVRALAERGIVEVEAAPRAGAPLDPRVEAVSGGAQRPDAFDGGDFDLMPEQTAAIETVMPAVINAREETFLLWGVTASGKTEVYLKLAAAALEAGRQVLVLVPEIALADQIVRSFRARFGPLVAIAHSAQNVGERWASWMAALSGDSRIMIGPRSVVFAPLPDPGLIVVDEEHDSAYKQEEGIRYNARDLAVVLGRFAPLPGRAGIRDAVGGIVSEQRAARALPACCGSARRVMERPLAEVEIVDLRAEHSKDRIRRRAKNGDRNANGGGEKLERAARCGAAVGAIARCATCQSRRWRAKRGVPQPPRLSQFSAMPSVRQRDRVRELQRQHDLSSARPFAALSLLRLRARPRPRSVPNAMASVWWARASAPSG